MFVCLEICYFCVISHLVLIIIFSNIFENKKILKAEDDDANSPNNCSLSLDDPNLISNFLNLTDLRLYKIVKWARNLPCFTSTLVFTGYNSIPLNGKQTF